ncbi:Abi-alpha family protein [Nocardia sp. BMG51109]|uniref:Abi-alpha family protein n=1 Tax=Nocardia sp. BMG51109 TaxID=1056816 RepID=UPI000462F9BD|nr:Abi-alpha family protein [Nocardia sp. BMG51109]
MGVNEPEYHESSDRSTELVARPPGELVKTDAARWYSPVRTATGVARVALSAVTEATAWGVGTAAGVADTVVRGSMAGRPPRDVLSEAGEQVRGSVRRALGIPPSGERPEHGPTPNLRERGAELLRLSAAVQPDETEHPAFARMLSELAPDEARILRFLYLDGAQPALDIRTGRPLSSGAQRIEPGLNMIGEDAAVGVPERVGSYLTNLRRLGLIESTRDPLDNPARYQLLESQPEVRRLLKRTGFGTKIFYRSIALTGFGTEFVRTCLPVPPLDEAL